MRMSALLPVTASPPGGPAQRAGGELGGEMALVVGRPALVGDRVAMLGGDPAGFDKGFLGGRLAAQVRLGLGRGELLRADRGQADADVGERAVREPHGRAGRRDRPVADAPLDLLVRAAATRPDRHPDLGQQLARADHGLVRPDVEPPDRDGTAAARPGDHDRRAQRGERGRQVLGRVGLADRPADRAAVPDDRVGDDPGLGSELGKQGEGVFDAGRPLVRELRWDLHPCSRGSRQLPKQPVYYGTSYRTARRSGKHRRHYRRHYGGNVPVSVDELPGRFRAALPPAVDARRADEVRADLLARWSEPHRHYHTLDHLAAVLSIVYITGPVALAAWFHDAVYDPRRDDNEEASARLAEAALNALELPADVIAEVARLVRLTATHDPEPGDRN